MKTSNRHQKIKAQGIIFDFDDTLVNSSKVYIEALGRVGIVDGDEHFSLAKKAVKTLIGNQHVNSHNRLLYFKEWLSLKGSVSPSKLLEMIQHYENELRVLFREQWRELERDRLFSDLRQLGIPFVILTNENLRTQTVKLAAIDPDGLIFKRMITSEEVGFEKPHHLIFHHAARSLDLELSKCIMIGDQPQVDLVPAKELGARTLLTTEFSKQLLNHQVEFEVIEKLSDLRSYLKKP